MLNLFFIMSSFRRRTRGKSAKYSNSTANIADHYTVQEPTVITIGTTRSVPVVPATDTFGTRKVKNFTLTIDSNNYEMPMAWALVYVPDGQEPSKLTVTGIADNKIPELFETRLVILEDYPNKVSGGNCLVKHIKDWGDRYAFTGECKGSHLQIDPGRFSLIITSNYPIEECFESQEDIKAIKRRYQEIHMTKENKVMIEAMELPLAILRDYDPVTSTADEDYGQQ